MHCLRLLPWCLLPIVLMQMAGPAAARHHAQPRKRAAVAPPFIFLDNSDVPESGAITAHFQDVRYGIDPASARIFVNGVDRTKVAHCTATSLICHLTPQIMGLSSVRVEVKNRAGALAVAAVDNEFSIVGETLPRVSYNLLRSSQIRVSIFECLYPPHKPMQTFLVRQILLHQGPGPAGVIWDGREESGRRLAQKSR